MRRVVIASPWRGDTERNHAYMKAAIRDCYQRGEAPIAPHAIGPLALDEEDPVQREMGIGAGLAWLGKADALVVYADLGISEGMWAEMMHAQQEGIQVEHRRLPAWETPAPAGRSGECSGCGHPGERHLDFSGLCTADGCGCVEHERRTA